MVRAMGQEKADALVDVSFEKMSKSKGNGVLPSEVTELHGVDALRSAILFSAPPEHDVNFDFAVVKSMESYLQRYFRLSETFIRSSKTDPAALQQRVFSASKQLSPETSAFLEESLDLLLDYEHHLSKTRQFHVGLARLMELTNRLYKQSSTHPDESDPLLLVFSYLTKALYPYCPHLASEVWETCFTGDPNLVHDDYSALK